MADVAIEEVEALLAEAEEALTADLPALQSELDAVLRYYDGIPSRIDVFDILGLHGHEDRHTLFLAWLLDPRAAHGLRDAALRGFLSLIDDSRVELLCRRGGALRAWVRPHLSFGDAGIPDLVMLVPGMPGIAVVLEAKIHAEVGYAPSRKAQTTAYADAVETLGVEELILKQCDKDFRAGTYEPVFVFLRAQTDQQPEPGIEEGPEQRYRIVDYGAVERMLASVVSQSDIPPDTRALVQQFRTSLLADALPRESSLDALDKLRALRSFGRKAGWGYLVAQELRELLRGFTSSGGSND